MPYPIMQETDTAATNRRLLALATARAALTGIEQTGGAFYLFAIVKPDNAATGTLTVVSANHTPMSLSNAAAEAVAAIARSFAHDTGAPMDEAISAAIGHVLLMARDLIETREPEQNAPSTDTLN